MRFQRASDSTDGDLAIQPFAVLDNDLDGLYDSLPLASQMMMQEDELDNFILRTGMQSICSTSIEEPQKFGDLAVGFCFFVLINIVTHRYLVDRRHERGDKTFCNLLLNVWKYKKPETFRRWLRIDPDVFDQLVADLNTYPGFHNNAYKKQTPVQIQVAIALHRLGSFGNRAAVAHVADLYGVSYGFVLRATNRVIMAAVLVDRVRYSVQWPSPEARLRAKEKVLELSGGIEELSHGWLIIDGTLMQLFERPHFCGSMFYDRKSRYSMNIQMTTLPTGEIIDYTVGHVGSAHDALSLRATQLYRDQKEDGPKKLLGPKEFAWADSAYPLHDWLIKPYSDKEIGGNKKHARFNKILARIRVRSEHTIGFLKGRFQSLQGLRMLIRNEDDKEFCMQWIRACINIHMYAFLRERDPCSLTNKFYRRGCRGEKQLQRRIRKAEQQALVNSASGSAPWSCRQ